CIVLALGEIEDHRRSLWSRFDRSLGGCFGCRLWGRFGFRRARAIRLRGSRAHKRDEQRSQQNGGAVHVARSAEIDEAMGLKASRSQPMVPGCACGLLQSSAPIM